MILYNLHKPIFEGLFVTVQQDKYLLNFVLNTDNRLHDKLDDKTPSRRVYNKLSCFSLCQPQIHGYLV